MYSDHANYAPSKRMPACLGRVYSSLLSPCHREVDSRDLRATSSDPSLEHLAASKNRFRNAMPPTKVHTHHGKMDKSDL